MSGFLGRPQLGGWLTILNGSFWVLFAVLGRFDLLDNTPRWILVPLIIVFSLPLAFPCMMPSMGHGSPRPEAVVVVSVVLGLNSFVWGYGIARAFTRVKPDLSAPVHRY